MTPFSNSHEAEIWLDNNCRQCWKGRSFISSIDAITNKRCKACEEIVFGFITGDVSPRTFAIVQTGGGCPNRQTERPKYPRKTDKYKNEPKLF